jgi:hypothetical protein
MWNQLLALVRSLDQNRGREQRSRHGIISRSREGALRVQFARHMKFRSVAIGKGSEKPAPHTLSDTGPHAFRPGRLPVDKVVLTGPPVELPAVNWAGKIQCASIPCPSPGSSSNLKILQEYVWHCHMLAHEDNQMMRPYLITECCPWKTYA